MINGAANIIGDFFAFSTIGDLSLYLSNGSLNAGNFILTAGDFVLGTINPPPGNPGTVFADTAFITTGNNFIADVNIDTVNDLAITAGGLIQFDQAISGGGINLWAQGGSITIDGVDAGAALNLLAATSINTGDILAGATVSIEAQGGLVDVGNVNGAFVELVATNSVAADNITSDANIHVTSGSDMVLGNLVAGVSIDDSDTAIRLRSGGSIFMLDGLAAGGIDFDAVGTATGGSLTTGIDLKGDAGGAINFGAISAGLVNPQGPPEAGFSVGSLSGHVDQCRQCRRRAGLGFATSGALTTGNLSAGTDVLGLASGNMTLGSITTGLAGRTYLADYAMFISAGGPDSFDPSLVFGTNPVPSTGSITINGPVSTGSFQAAGASINAGNISGQQLCRDVRRRRRDQFRFPHCWRLCRRSGGRSDPVRQCDVRRGHRLRQWFDGHRWRGHVRQFDHGRGQWQYRAWSAVGWNRRSELGDRCRLFGRPGDQWVDQHRRGQRSGRHRARRRWGRLRPAI